MLPWLSQVMRDPLVKGSLVAFVVFLVISFVLAGRVSYWSGLSKSLTDLTAQGTASRNEKLLDHYRIAALNFAFLMFATASAVSVFGFQRLQQQYILKVQELRKALSILDLALFEQGNDTDSIQSIEERVLAKGRYLYTKEAMKEKIPNEFQLDTDLDLTPEWLEKDYFVNKSTKISRDFDVSTLRTQAAEILSNLNEDTRSVYFDADENAIRKAAYITDLDSAVIAYSSFASKLTETKESAGSSVGSNNLNVDRIGDVYKSVTFANIGDLKFAMLKVMSLECFLMSKLYDDLNNNSPNYTLKEFSFPKIEDYRSPTSDGKFDGDKFISKNEVSLNNYKIASGRSCLDYIAAKIKNAENHAKSREMLDDILKQFFGKHLNSKQDLLK